LLDSLLQEIQEKRVVLGEDRDVREWRGRS